MVVTPKCNPMPNIIGGQAKGLRDSDLSEGTEITKVSPKSDEIERI